MSDKIFENALTYFQKTYDLDLERGVIEAKKAPAYSNMKFTENILQQISASNRQRLNTAYRPQSLLSRDFWRQTFWSDFMVGGLLSDFLVSILRLWPESIFLNEIIAVRASLITALIGFIACGLFVFDRYIKRN